MVIGRNSIASQCLGGETMSEMSSAEIASKETLAAMFKAIDNNQCFRLEAGAGAGKTYSLIKALRYLIENKSKIYSKKSQQVVCITYTNVAKDEILERTDNNPLVLTETIHGFAWSFINVFQKQLRTFIPELNQRWKDRIELAGGITTQTVTYDLGHPNVSNQKISLHHDDVIELFCRFLTQPKFQELLVSNYPIIFIDEYQDTNKRLAESIITNLIETEKQILIGFFGDHWQKIYGSTSCGLISDANGRIQEINKRANFRSNKVIVEMLNRMRPELPQYIFDERPGGEIKIFHSNSWQGTRQSANHWQGDLPKEEAHNYLKKVMDLLETSGWDFNSSNTKILMLTHNILAAEQGYNNLTDCFSNSDDYLKGNNRYIKFFIEQLIPIKMCFITRKYGEMFEVIGRNTVPLMCQDDKVTWNIDLERVNELMEEGTIGDVLDFLIEAKHIRLPSKVEESERKYQVLDSMSPDEPMEDKDLRFVDWLRKLRNVKFKEVEKLYDFINEKTLFSTNHGVKGAEFENVLIVCGRGWNNYNWNDFLEWMSGNIPSNKLATFERNRNLFYVACSRPKMRLSILFTQQLSENAMTSVRKIFGNENVIGEPRVVQ